MKTEKKQTRQDKLDDGQCYTGFDLNGKRHKPLTGGAMKFLQRIKSPLYTNDFTDCSELDVVIEYLFATSASSDELCDAPKDWEKISFRFADEYTIADLTNPIIMDSITRDLKNQSAASFEVKSESEKK